MREFNVPTKTRATIVFSAAMIALAAAAPLRGDAAPDEQAAGSISGRVLNADESPVVGARVRLFLDDVDAEPRAYKELKAFETDDTGRFEFPNLPKAYYLVVVDREGSARTFRAFVLEDGSQLSQDFILRKPVRSALIARDEFGRPLAGARLRFLMPRDDNGEFWFRTRRDWETFATLPVPSDETGRLDLPELPEGAVIEANIEHPDFAPAEVKEITVRPDVAAEVVLKPGVAVSLKIAADGKGERPQEVEIDLRHDPFSHPSTIIFHRFPLDADGAAHLTVEAGRYSFVRLTHEDYHLTPVYSPSISKGEYLCLGESARHEFHFVAQRKVKVRGRVVDADGKPVVDAYMQGEIPNVGPDGRVPEGDNEWAHAGWSKTDANGEYVVSLAPGRVRVSFHGERYVPTEPFSEFDVVADGSAVAPEIKVGPMPKVAGVVRDAEGRPVVGAVVRLRGLLRGLQPTTTDENGRFELAPTWMPADPETEEPQPLQPLVAFHPYERLAAHTDVRLDEPDSLRNIVLTLAPHEPGAMIEEFRDELTSSERGEIPEDRASEMAAATLKGRPALELDGTWLNIEEPAEGLAAFRGKYVLLDFWFIGCGPCHADFPSVKLLHDLYKDRGLVVIAVHDNSSDADAVREFAAKEGMTVPIVVDEPDNRTNLRYEGHGLSGYPSHILIGPDGTVFDDDRTTPGPSLRSYKIELIRELLLDDATGS